KKLEAMPPMSAESTVSRNYLDWLLAVPWKKRSKEIRNITRAEKVLNEDHYGLEKIKERILEFLQFLSWERIPKDQFFASSDLPESERPLWECRSRRLRGASSYACRWAVCETKPKFAVIAALTSVPCLARLSR